MKLVANLLSLFSYKNTKFKIYRTINFLITMVITFFWLCELYKT